MIHTLLLGLGGTGSRVVNKVAQELRSKHIEINDGVICCAVMDTNTNDNEALSKTGTNIPVIETSSTQTVGDLLRRHTATGRKVKEWCVDELDYAPFMSEKMDDGASTFRMKSRLAFLDTYTNSSKISGIEGMISDMIAADDGKGPNFRVMIVSSVSGGTGAGMFVQTALWLRNIFKKKDKEIKLRGILLLPDIFVNTVPSIGNNTDLVRRHYANAYAAMREINAINKIKLDSDYKPRFPMKIDDLFDSEKTYNVIETSQKGVFDRVFLIDYANEAGAVLPSVSAYEDLAAHLAYTQLFSPMTKNIFSEEDNVRAQTPGLLFDACGTSKAVYPKEEVMDFCIMSTVSDMIKSDWRQIDIQIDATRRQEKAREEAGENVAYHINPIEAYMQIFEDKISKTGTAVGKNKFFASLKKEVPDTKISDFMKALDDMISSRINAENKGNRGFAGLNALGLKVDGKISEEVLTASKEDVAESTLESLKALVETNNNIVEKTLKQFDGTGRYILSDNIIGEVFPNIMGDLNMHNPNSVYGFLTQHDEDTNLTSFVHPVTMRYLLYKLQDEIKTKRQEIDKKLKSARGNVLSATAENADVAFDFDYARTGREETLENYFEKAPGFLQGGEGPYKQYFIRNYRAYLYCQYMAGKAYELNALKAEVLAELAKRLATLIEHLEGFFKLLPEISKNCEKEIEDNLENTAKSTSSVAYICGSKEAKKYIYESLGLDFAGGDQKTSKTVIDAVYGMFCAGSVPDAESNMKYVNFDIQDAFLNGVKEFYTDLLTTKCAKKIDLDIYEAVAAELESQGDKTNPVTKMRALVSKLRLNASPFVNYDNVGQTLGTFWGFHPSLVKDRPELDNIGMGNTQQQSDEAYPKNELSCFTAVYNIDTNCFMKFRENEEGVYYCSYMEIANTLSDEKRASLYNTPHLDKTWHKTLPYLTQEKQEQADSSFCEAILRAFAYDYLRIDGNCYQIRRGNDWETICKGDLAIRKNEFADIVKFLLGDTGFKKDIIPLMERKYKDETTRLSSYAETKIYQYFLIQDDRNPVKLIVTYSNSRDCDKTLKDGMIKAIENAVGSLINAYDTSRYDMNRSDTSKFDAQTKLLSKIYNAAGDIKGKDGIFMSWTERSGFKIETAAATENA